MAPERLKALTTIDLEKLPEVAAGVRIGAPLAGIRQFVAIGLNYRKHAAESGLEIPKGFERRFPIAWMRDTRRGRTADPRIPADVTECDGGCDKCQLCWGMRPGQSVVFNRH